MQKLVIDIELAMDIQYKCIVCSALYLYYTEVLLQHVNYKILRISHIRIAIYI